jgi:septum site-determining protein MinC
MKATLMSVDSLTNQTSNTSMDDSACFELKGSILTMLEIHLLDNDVSEFEHQLNAKVRQAPDFFKKAPVVIDLVDMKNRGDVPDFSALTDVIRRNKLLPIGVRNGSTAQHKLAEELGLYVLPDSAVKSGATNDRLAKGESRGDSAASKPAAEKPAASSNYSPPQISSYSKTIYQPVRSGQQIYAKDSDLVVMATVSAGAEIIADGHIHVYGALRGKALAGVHGDENARIFCRDLEAELISIAGYYRVMEEIEESYRHHAVQIYLKDQRLTIEKF